MSLQNKSTSGGQCRLTQLPIEVLTQILELLLPEPSYDVDTYHADGSVTTTTHSHVAEPKYPLAARDDVIDGDRYMPRYTRLQRNDHMGILRGGLALISLHPTLHEVGFKALYSRYVFQSSSAESFRVLFAKHIGHGNLAQIRTLVFGLPHAVKTMPSKYLGRYLRMLQKGMPELESFTITTSTGG
jgi:hypothetical protein